MTWLSTRPRLLLRTASRLGVRAAARARGVPALTALAVFMLATPTPTPTVPETLEPRWRAPLAPPIRVLRHFAPPSLPWLSGHRGVDLAAEPGTQIHAAGAGRVGYAGDVAGRGVVTILHEGGLRTTCRCARWSSVARPYGPAT